MGSLLSKSKYETNEIKDLDTDLLKNLENHTCFTKHEIKHWYKGFCREFPRELKKQENKITEQQFINLYQQFYPQGNPELWARILFERYNERGLTRTYFSRNLTLPELLPEEDNDVSHVNQGYEGYFVSRATLERESTTMSGNNKYQNNSKNNVYQSPIETKLSNSTFYEAPEETGNLHSITQKKQRNKPKMTFEGFILSLAVMSRSNLNTKLRWVFHTIDTDANNNLSKDELRRLIEAVLMIFGQRLEIIGCSSPEQKLSETIDAYVDEFFNTLDADGDDQLSLDEFLNVMQRNSSGRVGQIRDALNGWNSLV